MEDSSDGKFWSSLRSFFSGKSQEHLKLKKIISNAIKENEITSNIGRMLLNILRLEKLQVREVMIPRTDIDCLEESASIKDVAGTIIRSGHSRIPIYRENKDQIVGIIHAKDILPILMDPDKNLTQSIKELKGLLRSPLFIPETKNIKDMLLEFQSKKVHLAIAIDEYGGTSGLITLEDILEEIVGEIEDEHDLPKPEEFKQIGPNTYLVSGRITLEDLKDRLGIELYSDYVETLGGYLIELSGKVPQAGETFKIKQCSFKVKEADNKHIFSIVVTLPSEDKE